MSPILVTGFGPFPGCPENPSAALARAVGQRLRRAPGGAARVLVLRTAYGAIPDALLPALAEAPAVLMLGVATRARRIRVEIRARNRASRLYPDASGRAAGRALLDPAAPAGRNGAATAQALAGLRRHGLDARLSNDAGRYLCNASYFAALGTGLPALFVHIPPVPRTRRPRRPGVGAAALPRQAAALADIARLLARRARPARAGV
ncbi:peptidase C15 [Methylobacterium gregans]|uniref:Pyroglutamyl-peptidase I n=1 Tax=Methylobacterium gregans TaxID=374424 RepID=A0AA37HKW3_9HYPH|nr:peptidase C15 [Methylobacterium gregans]MDQ0523964.1 pyroglutamyl-peptidase [Methylobacterium gregans]GJD77440.1 Pyrrolidone-carboxylate peptidase [Methylobacterium gregans]GLS56069.1 peptidase C15 [Methylobacterium gregans]